MTSDQEHLKAHKVRLDNRLGCSVDHAFRNFNPPTRFDATPAPAVPALHRSPYLPSTGSNCRASTMTKPSVS